MKSMKQEQVQPASSKIVKYRKPTLNQIGTLQNIQAKAGNGGDHNDGTYFRYRAYKPTVK